jgi:TRAP-type C4-dicarboxylate transport system permease small subunit
MDMPINQQPLSTTGKAVLSVHNFLEIISQFCFSIAKWLLIACMGFIFFFVILQVFCRYVLETPLLWPEDVTRWLLVWTAYLGASIALRKGDHISLTMFVNRLPQRLRFWILFAGKFVILFFLIIFTGYGYIQAMTNPAFSWQVGISYKYPMLGMPLTGAFMLVHILLLINIDILSLTDIPEGKLKSLRENLSH